MIRQRLRLGLLDILSRLETITPSNITFFFVFGHSENCRVKIGSSYFAKPVLGYGSVATYWVRINRAMNVATEERIEKIKQ